MANPVQKNSVNTYHGYAITDFYDTMGSHLDDYIDSQTRPIQWT